MRSPPLILLMLTLAAPGAALAQADRETLERGQALATQWCSACHATSAEATGPRNDAAPAFTVIAGRQGATAEGIATYLGVPHASMPDLGLSARQAMDLGLHVMAQRPR